jgi:hypothetical protein
VACSDPVFKYHAILTEGAYNDAFPSLWERIKRDGVALRVFAARIGRYGVLMEGV